MFKSLLRKKPLARVTLLPGEASFEVGRNKTILESALEAGIKFPHDCTVGTCGSCRSRLVVGKVDAITPFGYTLSREELEAGCILACQAVPKGDVSIEVDLSGTDQQIWNATGRIVASEALTHDIVRVTWKTDTPVSFVAGQYVRVSWPGAPASRAYSFANAPGDAPSHTFTTFIRLVPGGAFTVPLFDGVFAQTTFDLIGPQGSFWLREGEGPILLIGGGSGLAPLISLLEDAAARGVKRDAVLLFGGRGARDLYCQEEIAAIAARWQGRFAFWPILSDEQTDSHRFGMVTGEIPTAIAELGGATGCQGYLCGPPGMIDAGVTTLLAAGIALTDIHYDKFTDASSQ